MYILVDINELKYNYLGGERELGWEKEKINFAFLKAKGKKRRRNQVACQRCGETYKYEMELTKINQSVWQSKGNWWDVCAREVPTHAQEGKGTKIPISDNF